MPDARSFSIILNSLGKVKSATNLQHRQVDVLKVTTVILPKDQTKD